MWNTFGHNQIKLLLDRQLHTGNLSHAYIFVGQESIGKRTLALEFANKIRGSQAGKTDPDVFTTTITNEFGVADARELIGRLRLKPFSGMYKVAIIDNANLLNIQSSNALLKTIEEPSSSTIVILIAQSRSLPDTILSRCQVINFTPLTLSQLKDFAVQKSLTLSESVLLLSRGSIGTLLEFLQQPEFLEKALATIKQFENLLAIPLAQRLVQVPILANEDTIELGRSCTTWQNYVLYESNLPPLSKVLVTKALESARLNFLTSVNKKLILERLLLALPASE